MHTQHAHAVSYESDYVSFEVTDRTILEGVPGDIAMIGSVEYVTKCKNFLSYIGEI